jgi:hypothetical protein
MKLLFTVHITALFAAGSLHAASLTLQPIRHAGAGATSKDSRFKITGSMGQPLVYVSTGAVFRLPSGFWPAAGSRVAEAPPCLALQCPTNLVVSCQSSNGAFVYFPVTATGPCASNDVVVICDPPSGSHFPLGTTLVHCRAIGGGLTNACSFPVTVLGDCPVPQPRIAFATNAPEIRLRMDRLVYGPNSAVQLDLELGARRLGGDTTHVVLICERSGDLEVVPVRRRTVERFTADAAEPVGFGVAPARLDGQLQANHSDTIWAFWRVDGLVDGASVSESLVTTFALAGDGTSTEAPQRVVPGIALTPDERIVPPGGKTISTLFVPGSLPIQVPVDELIVHPKDAAQLDEILARTGGTILTPDRLPDELAQGATPTAYLLRVDATRGDAAALPLMRSFIGARRQLFAASEAGLRIVSLALQLQLLGYQAGLNPRLHHHGVPGLSPEEESKLTVAMLNPLFDFPRVWALMALMDRDTARIPVAFLDQGFSPNRDFRRPASGVLHECDMEGRTLEDFFAGFTCGPGVAESPPTTGASLVGAPVWHGNGVVSIAGAVANNNFGVAGTGGQVVEPMLYRYGLSSYAFEIGLGIRRAVLDGAAVINLSAGFPCEIQTWLGADPNWCDPLGRAAFCAELPLHLAVALGVACASAVDCDVPILCDIVEGLAGLVCTVGGFTISLAVVTPACLAYTLPLGDLGDPMDQAIRFARDAGVPVVVSAGNKLEPESLPEFIRPLIDLSSCDVATWQIQPAMQPDVIVCGAARDYFPHENLHFHGARVDVWAPIAGNYMGPPGVEAVEPNDQFHTVQSLDGTSAAAPYISGIIANLMALNPRLNPRNPALTPAQRGQIPRLIRQVLKAHAYTPAQLTALAPEGDMRTGTEQAGLIRRNLVNPLATLNAAAFDSLPDLSPPALPRFTDLGYEGGMNFDEADPSVASDVPGTAKPLAPGAPPLAGTILVLRGEGGYSSRADIDYFTFQMPAAPPGLWQALLEVTQPRNFESVVVRSRAGEILTGTRVLESPLEQTTWHRSPALFHGATGWASLGSVGGVDNVYKVKLAAFERVGDLPLADLFDRNDPLLTPPESQPNNNVASRGGRLGPSAPYEWRTETRAGSLLESRVLRVRELNFHTPTDEDWFCVTPPTNFPLSACHTDLTFDAGVGATITLYHQGRTEVLAQGGGRLTVPASLLAGTTLCVQLMSSDPGHPVNYALEVRLTRLSADICDAVDRISVGHGAPGHFGHLDDSRPIPFPGMLPDRPPGIIPWCDERVCDPAERSGRRALDGLGRILSPDLYRIDWGTFGRFAMELEVTEGASLRAELLDAQGQVLATASELSDLNNTNLSGGGFTLELSRDGLLPGQYFLKLDRGFPGTRLHVFLPGGASPGRPLSIVERIAVRTQPEPPTFADWVKAILPPGLNTNAAADPDGDGWTTRQEYVFGSNPALSNDTRRPVILPPPDSPAGDFQIRFTRPIWATDLDYHLEGAARLDPPIPWESIEPIETRCLPLWPGFEEVIWTIRWPRDFGVFRPGARPLGPPVDLPIPPPPPGESMRVGFFNAQFLAEPFTDDSPCCDGVDARPERIARRILATGFDVIALAEMFTDEKEILVNLLRPQFPYYVQELDDAEVAVEQDSGLMLFSKFPFVELPPIPGHFRRDVEAFVPAPRRPGIIEPRTWVEWSSVAFAEFDEFPVAGGLPFPDCFSAVGDPPVLVPKETPCWGPDCLASKGAGLVRVKHPRSERIFNIVFTHLDADGSPCDRHVRVEQLRLIDRMLREVLGTRVLSEPLLVLGDLNINGGDTDFAATGVQRDPEWLDRFGPDGDFVLHLAPDGVGNPLPLRDLWEAQNRLSDGLPDDCRDPGLTASVQYSMTNRSRLNYLFMNTQAVQDLVVQHVALAYGLKDFEPFHPAAFGQEGRQILSDHIGLIADINTRSPHASPTEAEPVTFTAALPEGPARFERAIDLAGGMKWFRIDAPGTYNISLESPDAGVEFQVYATFELSRPLTADPRSDSGDTSDRLAGAINPSPFLRTTPHLYTSQGGCPLLIRVSHRDRSAVSSFKLEVRRHLGLTRETAILLHAKAPPTDVPIATGLLTETGQRWFRILTERADSGLPQTLLAHLNPRDGKSYTFAWVRPSGEPLATGTTSIPLSLVGGEETYLVATVPADASRFDIQWSTDLTVLLLDGPVLCRGGHHLAINCEEITDDFGILEEDDDVRLEIEIESAPFHIRPVGPVQVTENWDSDQQYGVGQFFHRPIRFLPGERVVVRLLEYDGAFRGREDGVEGSVPFLDPATEFNCFASSELTEDSGRYRFLYRLAHRSR